MENCEIGSFIWAKLELFPIWEIQETLHGLGPFVFRLQRITTFDVFGSNIVVDVSLLGVLSGLSNISCDMNCGIPLGAPSNRR